MTQVYVQCNCNVSQQKLTSTTAFYVKCNYCIIIDNNTDDTRLCKMKLQCVTIYANTPITYRCEIQLQCVAIYTNTALFHVKIDANLPPYMIISLCHRHTSFISSFRYHHLTILPFTVQSHISHLSWPKCYESMALVRKSFASSKQKPCLGSF